MSTKLSEMISAYGDQDTALTQSLSAIQVQITDLQEQQTELETVLATIETEMDALLLTKKNENNWEYIWKDADYGVTNIDDWYLADQHPLSNTVNYIDSNTFRIDGDQTGDFTTSTIILAHCGVNGIKKGVVSNSTSLSGGLETEVDLNTNALTPNLSGVGIVAYEYNGIGWDSDSDIEQRIDEWDFTYDHLTQTLGLFGTYGIDESIIQLQNAEGLIKSNRNKYRQAVIKYARFV